MSQIRSSAIGSEYVVQSDETIYKKTQQVIKNILLLFGFINLLYGQPKILLMCYFPNGGHYASAKAVESALQRLGEFDIDMHYLNNVNSYYRILKNYIWLYALITRIDSKIADWYFRVANFRQIRSTIKAKDYHLVVCNVPFLQSIARDICLQLRIPLIVIPPDLDEPRPNHWIQKQAGTYYFSGSPYLHAKTVSYPNSINICGMVLRDEFRHIREISKKDMKINLGLDPNKKVVLITFGAAGSKYMLEIAQIAKNDTSKYYIFICGIADNLKKKIDSMKRPHFITTGYTNNMHEYTRAADVMIGKPGPGCVSECVECQTPVILKNCWLDVMAQEESTLRWVKEKGYGVLIKDYNQDLVKAISQALEIDTSQWPLNNAADEAAYAIINVIRQYGAYRKRLGY